MTKEEEDQAVAEAVRLRLEKEKAKEDQAVAEAVRLRLKNEKANRFRCHSCRKDFAKPKTHGGNFGCGIALILGSGLVLFNTYSVAVKSVSVEGIGFGSWLAFVSFFVGLSVFTVSNLKPPCCPECESTNFSRPEKTDDPK